jgi:ABC-type transport system involved in multi-copper enzyme maturation permease subunit
MFGRVSAIAMNTYREAVRARVLLVLLGLALATSLYSLVIAAMSVRQEMRIVADIGSASISLYAVFVSVVLGATSLHRELELKTIFPILTRRLRRHEYVLGKYLGIFATLLAFVAIDAAAVLAIMAVQSKQHVPLTIGVVGALLVALVVLLVRAKYSRVFVVLPWSIALFLAMVLLSDGAGGERQLVVASAILTLGEVAIVGAIAMLFSSFSSPGLTAAFTAWLFLIGRSADTMGNIPERLFGSTVRTIGIVLAKIVPNLNLYVPARPLLLGQLAAVPIWGYVGRAWLNAIFYAAVLLTLSAVVFRRRDFQ